MAGLFKRCMMLYELYDIVWVYDSHRWPPGSTAKLFLKHRYSSGWFPNFTWNWKRWESLQNALWDLDKMLYWVFCLTYYDHIQLGPKTSNSCCFCQAHSLHVLVAPSGRDTDGNFGGLHPTTSKPVPGSQRCSYSIGGGDLGNIWIQITYERIRMHMNIFDYILTYEHKLLCECSRPMAIHFFHSRGLFKTTNQEMQRSDAKVSPQNPNRWWFCPWNSPPNVGSQGLGIVVYPGFGLVLQRHPHLRCGWLMETPQNSPHWLIKM